MSIHINYINNIPIIIESGFNSVEDTYITSINSDSSRDSNSTINSDSTRESDLDCITRVDFVKDLNMNLCNSKILVESNINEFTKTQHPTKQTMQKEIKKSDSRNSLDSITSFESISLESCIESKIVCSDITYLIPELIISYKEKVIGASYRIGGSGKDNMENQDTSSVCFITLDGIEYTLNTMCDGHGIYGKEYANITAFVLPELITDKFIDVLKNPFVIIKEIFAEFVKQLRITMDSKDGGTTVTVSILSDGCLIVANIADCEALIKIDALKESILVEHNGQYINTEITNGVIRATVDHNINNNYEVARVLNTGARIKYATAAKVNQIDVFKKLYSNRYTKIPFKNQVGSYASNVSS